MTKQHHFPVSLHDYTSLKKTYFCLVEIYGITILGSGSLGCLFSSTIIALQASVEIKDIAVVTGLGNFSRILGGALGVAISSAVLNSHLNQELPNLLPIDEATKVIQSSEYVNHGLSEEYKVLVIEVYVHGLQTICIILYAAMSKLLQLPNKKMKPIKLIA
ncbi:hypothetical protein G6F37_014017 [Rhizopus arrhizus]|nr:hypothetical protein G6F37_014017 [Rhizopus arrhizus]